MLQAVRKIYQVDGTEGDIAATVDMLRKELPHAKIIDLLFHDFGGLTPEQVVDEAMRREAEYAREAGLK
jgi:hypothetical protein